MAPRQTVLTFAAIAGSHQAHDMNIPEGFTPRGDSNEQPPETYDKKVDVIVLSRNGREAEICSIPANGLPWKIPHGSMRIIAYRTLP